MTTELVLLIMVFVFLTAKAFFGPLGPFKTFEKSGPHLGARLEKQITLGRSFHGKPGAGVDWQPPDRDPSSGAWKR